MTGEESLYNIAEIAIALAGFSGLVAVFRSEHLGSWLPRERFLFWLLLACAFGVLFFALIPVTLHHLAFSDGAVWAISSALAASYYAAMLGTACVAHLRMNKAGHPTSRPAAWYVFLPLSVLVIVLLVLNAAGVVFDRSVGVYHAALLVGLVAASTFFVFLLIFPLGGRRG